ncbi:hypothetical protein SLA2020_102090 [Shorea laevis]
MRSFQWRKANKEVFVALFYNVKCSQIALAVHVQLWGNKLLVEQWRNSQGWAIPASIVSNKAHRDIVADI